MVRAPSGGATIHSVFDADGNRIAEYDQTSGAVIREYVWFDGAGVQVWSASYLPFGSVRTATGTPITLRFPGQWFQSESGLNQNWMRDYDPTTGRYIQADPLGLIDGASVYGYARQSPGRYTDPTGEFIPILVGLALGIAIDFAVDRLEQYCGCDDVSSSMPEVPMIWEAYGVYAGGTGAFETKRRKGIGGGGKSGDKTSSWSKYFGSDKSNPSGAARRAWGRKAAKRIPYVGAVLGLYDASRLGSCFYNKWSKS